MEDYILNLLYTIGFAACVTIFVQVFHIKYKNKIFIGIFVLSIIYFVTMCFKTYKTNNSFDCNKIKSLIDKIKEKNKVYEEQINELNSNINKYKNSDSTFTINEKIRKIKFEKISSNEILFISLKKLNEQCDGSDTIKSNYEELLTNFTDINEK